MPIITKEMEICAAHWLPFHNGKCKHLHGHSYRFVVTAEGIVDPKTNFVMDFGELKKVMEATIGKWDHALLVHYDFTETRELFSSLNVFVMMPNDRSEKPGASIATMLGLGDAARIIPIGCFTTAENLSRVAAEMILPRCPETVKSVTVECWETKSSSATSTIVRDPKEICWEGQGWYAPIRTVSNIPRYTRRSSSREISPTMMVTSDLEWFDAAPPLWTIVNSVPKS